MPHSESNGSASRSRTKAALWALLALLTFDLAYSIPACRILILVYPFALTQTLPHISRRNRDLL